MQTTRTQGIHTREKERKPLAIALVSLVPKRNIAPYITQASASAPLVQEFCYEVNHNSSSMNLMDIINCKKREKNNSKALTGGPGKRGPIAHFQKECQNGARMGAHSILGLLGGTIACAKLFC